ncbi:N-alpha-acetyltransferase 40 isoform X3 [Ricinus communis]|uniref:N-alpha-acetyltransferase 40 isoform X3 n=1 Tax=Ricinus communis TaxID=3988 RepID=UPI00201A566B|nr:N-alpha-acetyltransferase 40 isoform X3 [Ricinus communis]
MESSALSTTLQDINGSNLSRQRKTKRKEIVEKRKAINELIKAASVENDHLASFPAFRQFDRTGSGDKLSSSLKRELQKLVKDNMERHYGHEWATEEKVKRREMVTPEARYIFVYEAANNNRKFIENEMILVGFVHYRFTLEEEFPVLYVYEIQLQSRVQGKGLGKFLMQLIECIARKSCMSAVVLTVQKANEAAMDFYKTKLRYNISSISPSMMGVDKNYEILCKAFDSEAEAILQVYQDGSITMAAWQLQTYTRMPADMVPLSWDTTDGF